jgi:outer membrane protein assembly factor BamB
MFIRTILSGTVLLAAFSIMAADWPVWRGAKGDGTTTEAVSTIGDAPLWETNVGSGYSAVSVYKGKLLTAGNKNDQDIIYCLDAATGKEIWTCAIKCAATKNYPGPRATPVTDGSNVYMVSRDGDLACVDFNTGKLKWSKSRLATGEVKNLKWGLASSVLLYDGMAIVNIGDKGMAFNAATGVPVWQSQGEGNYSTPVAFTYQNKACLAIFSAEKLLILEPRTGNEIASYPWITKYNVNAADPLITADGSRIFISSGYGHGSALLGFDGQSLKKIWENNKLCSHFTTPILIDGIVYGVNGTGGKGNLCAIKLSDGSLYWQSEIKFGSFIQAGDKFVYIEDNGTLNLIQPSAEKCGVLKTVKISKLGSAKCWTMPVVAEGRIYCRNANGLLVCIAAQ